MKNKQKCFQCENGVFERLSTTYVVPTQDGENVAVPNIVLWRCNACGEEVLPPESSRSVEQWISREEDRFTPTEVDAFLAAFNTDQTSAAHDLGFGTKTFHRWSAGTQQVSRSMGYYLRALIQFPEVFAWIKQRRWRNNQSPALSSARGFFIEAHWTDVSDAERFPSLTRTAQSPAIRAIGYRHQNPALGLCGIDQE
jgi:YgiT-type zinc finger domain-containing protein